MDKYISWLTGDIVLVTKTTKNNVEYTKEEPNSICVSEGKYREISDFCKPKYVFEQIYTKL
jgi:hypothetical protein